MTDAWRSLGKVTVTSSGTPVRVTVNETVPEDRLSVHSILIQAHPTNAGKVYIMDRANGVIATCVGVLAVLAVPATNIIPSASATITFAPAAINASQYWVDADTNGDAVIVSIIQA